MNFIGLFSVFILFIKDGFPLRITRLMVDNPMIAGEDAWLRCDWEEGKRQIYTAKWYFNQHEFYRWTPTDRNPIKTFHRPEFEVDISRSREGHVNIKNILPSTKGIVSCEVSEEGPVFYTELNSTKIFVVALPTTQPIISEPLPEYQLRRDVSLTCTSSGSKPPANLTFYINDKPVDRKWIIPTRTARERGGVYKSVLGLRFPLLPKHIRRDRVSVKCAAKLLQLYWKSTEVDIIVKLPQQASRMEERASTSSRAGLTKIQVVTLILALISIR